MKTNTLNKISNFEEIIGEDSNEEKHILIAKEALIAEANSVTALASRIGRDFSDAVELILKCKSRVVVCGIGKSGLVGKKLVATLASTGTPSFYLHPAEAFHGDLGMLTPTDLLILISYSGETEEIIKLIPSLKQFGNRVIAMTGNGNSTLAKNADVWLDIAVEREVCPNNLAPTTSTLVTMAMGDALAVALIHAREFKPLDFARFHPGGSLGRRLLTRVRDVMHMNVPVVDTKTGLFDCMFKMTEGRLGMVIVLEDGEVKGVVTDGDLRRILLKRPDQRAILVSEFMNHSPLMIDAETPISDAETYMRYHKVKALVVTEKGSTVPIGVVEIFD